MRERKRSFLNLRSFSCSRLPLFTHQTEGSICSLKGNPYVIIPEANFRILQGEESLTEYRFETKKAKHLFCKVCGVQSFYRPRSNPEGVSVLVPALDNSTIDKVEVGTFDGQNWEEAFAKGKPAPCE